MNLKTAVIATLTTLLAGTNSFAAEKHDNALALIDAWLEAQYAYDRVPGLTAAIVHDQDVLWSRALGYADVEQQVPAATDTIFGICSISKLFTGIAAMQLRDKGLYRLDDPVSELLPWFNIENAHVDGPEITLEGLLTHSAGMPRESDTPYWMGPDFSFPTEGELREILSGQETLYSASEYFQYSNLGLSLVGEIVAAQSGQDYEAYVRENVLTPMGLADTDTGFPEDERKNRVATGYGSPMRDGTIAPLPLYDARAITPAAGFSSTALDLVKFASWQLRTRQGEDDAVLAPHTLKEMQRVHWIDWDFSNSWGLAFGIYRIDNTTLVGHSGHCPGFSTRVYIDPLTDYGVSVLANRNAADVSGYARSMLKILDAGGDSANGKNGEEAPSLEYSDYLGAYDYYPWGSEALVVRWKDGLALAWIPTSNPLTDLTQLKHIEGDTFRVIRQDKSLAESVVFNRDESGRVVSFTRHSLVIPRRP